MHVKSDGAVPTRKEHVLNSLRMEVEESSIVEKALSKRIDELDSSSVLEDCLFHLCTDLLCEESRVAATALYRFLEVFGEYPFSMTVLLCAFSCVCRTTTPQYGGLIEMMMRKQVDPFKIVSSWPCSCGGNCLLARRRCFGKAPVELAIHAMNHSALHGIYSATSERRLDSRLIAPLFRRNGRFHPTQVEKTREVMIKIFPEKENLEIYAGAKLIAILEDGRTGVLEFLPIEEVGLFGRTARQLVGGLTSLDGKSSILFLVAGTDSTIPGRDSIFRFLLDMRVPVSVLDKGGRSIVEFAFRENPSFWLSQAVSGSSPACALLGRVDVPPIVYRSFFHLQEFRQRCHCKTCSLWSANPACYEALHDWIRQYASVDEGITYSGYEIIHHLQFKREREAIDLVKKGGLLTVTDSVGNTALHLASDVDLLQLLVEKGADPNWKNASGRTPLDMAVIKGDIQKFSFLLKQCHCLVTCTSLERICSLVEGNAELFRVFRDSLRHITLQPPRPSADLEIAKLKSALQEEIDYRKRKIDSLKRERQIELDNLTLQHHAQIQESTKLAQTAMKKLGDENRTMFTKNGELESRVAVLTKRYTALEELNKSSEKKARHRESQLAQLEQELKTLRRECEDRDCPLCMEREWNTALMCGHCYCRGCVEAACKEKCSICNKKTSGKFIELYNCSN